MEFCGCSDDNGLANVQYYWVGGHREAETIRIPVAYIVREDRMFPIQHAFLRPSVRDPSSGEHCWDHRFGTWNRECSMCHSVGAKPGLNPVSNSLHTEVVEFGMSCESCHGPGKKHVEFHQLATSKDVDGAEKMFISSEVTHEQSTHMCGRGHDEIASRNLINYAVHGLQFQSGDRLEQ